MLGNYHLYSTNILYTYLRYNNVYNLINPLSGHVVASNIHCINIEDNKLGRMFMLLLTVSAILMPVILNICLCSNVGEIGNKSKKCEYLDLVTN